MAMSQKAVYKLTVKATLDGQAIQNVFHYTVTPKVGSTAIAATPADLLVSFATYWHGDVLTKLVSNYTVHQYRVVEILGRTSNVLGAKLVYGAYAENTPVAANRNGTLLTNYGPSFVTAPIKKATGLVGKSNRGWWQFGPLDQTYYDGNMLTDAGDAALISFKDLFLTLSVGAAPDVADLVIFNQRLYIGTKTKAPVITFDNTNPTTATALVETMELPLYVGSQNHRKVRRKDGD